MKRRAYVLTVSDSVTAGERTDTSGPAVCQRLHELGWEAECHVLPDDYGSIVLRLRGLADSGGYSVILTTGGTGVASRDCTPEATREVIDTEIPGIGEVMRTEGRRFTPLAALARGIGGVRKRTVIVNLPGSPAGAVQSLDAIADLIPHVVDLLEGNTGHHNLPEPAKETAPGQRASEK